MEDTENTTQMQNPGSKANKRKKKFFERRSAWFLMAFILVLIFFVLGTVTGAARGIKDRVALSESQAAPKVQSQLDGARQDITEGRYEIALNRLDWILDEMTDFLTEAELAEVGELYSHALLEISSQKTPVPQPSPTVTVPVFTPTPDLRGVQELFDSAQQLIINGNWEDAILTIQALRENDLSFRSVQVDGFLYMALRNRGIQKIIAEGSLEPGLFDLTLAERFAPLDSRAEGLRTWTRLYITGASYWDVDWYQVVYYFEQIYPHLPNLHDGTFMTATERYRIGSIEYATQLLAAGEYCLAQEFFEKALSISEDPSARSLSQEAAEACLSGAAPPEDTQIIEQTPTPSGEDTTPEPTVEPTEEPPGSPGG